MTWAGFNTVQPERTLFALVIGISKYQEKKIELKYAAKDASDVAKILMEQEGRYYDKVEVVELLDEKADKASIENELAGLRRRVKPDDTAIVFMAGHGTMDDASDFYFLPVEGTFDEGRRAGADVNGYIIRNELSKIHGRVVLMIDACRSGSGIQGLVDMDRLSNDLTQNTGLVMFAASTGRQDALESSTWNNGAFTSALLSIFSDPRAYGNDRRLSISELDEELSTRVSALTQGQQNAVMTKYGAIPRFFLASIE